MQLDSLGKILLVTGVVIAALGAGIMLAGRIPFFGSLPGDLSFQHEGVKVYIPIATSIVISIILTVVLNLVLGIFGRR